MSLPRKDIFPHEGAAYAVLIAWYDTSFKHPQGKLSRFIANIGTYSYSIYLLHFFVVFKLSQMVHKYVFDLSNIYVALLFSLPSFLLMVPIGYISFTLIESPFLRFRRKYIVAEAPKA